MATPANRRKIWIASLVVCVLALFVALATLNAFNTQLPTPATTQQIVIFTGLSVVAFLLFVAVLILLVRNVLKLYADQRSRVMGTRLRTRMLWGAVLVSLIPVASMFAFSYLLLNRAVDRWFSQPVTEMRDDATVWLWSWLGIRRRMRGLRRIRLPQVCLRLQRRCRLVR